MEKAEVLELINDFKLFNLFFKIIWSASIGGNENTESRCVSLA